MGMPLAASLTVVILLAIAAAAILFLLLKYAVDRLAATAAGAATGGAPPAPPAFVQPLQDLLDELQRAQAAGEVTPDDCARLRAAYDAAVAAGAPTAQTDPARDAIDALCPE